MNISPLLKTFGDTFGGTAEVTVNPDTKEGVATLIIGVHAVRIRSGEELYDKIRNSITTGKRGVEQIVAQAIFEKLIKQAYGQYHNWLLKRIADNQSIKVRISTKGYKIFYRDKIVCSTSVDTENYEPHYALKVCSELAQERLYEIYSGQDLMSLHVINNIEKHIF